MAKRYGISAETVRKWHKRGTADCLDHSARLHQLPWKASEEELAIVCALRQATSFPLDDLASIVSHFLPHLKHDSAWRIFKAEGLSRRSKLSSDQPVGFSTAYNARQQRVLDGETPNQVVISHLKARPEPANLAPYGCVGPCDITKARLILTGGQEVSQPDKYYEPAG